MSALLLRHIGLPLIFLTVALLGGLRFAATDHALRFVAPPLTTLLLATAMLLLFGRSRLIDAGRDWISPDQAPEVNLSNGLTLVLLFAATVQVFNAVLPEDALFFTLFAIVFALALWNSLLATILPHRLVVSLGGLLLAAFVVKYLLLASLFEPSDSVGRSIVQSVLRGVTLGGIESEPYARATGYTAFACVALYLVGLWASSPVRDARSDRFAALLANPDALTDDQRQRILDVLVPREITAGRDGSISVVESVEATEDVDAVDADEDGPLR